MTAHDILVERLVRAGKAAGQDALARVAYEMARRCWSEASATKASHVRWIEDPRSVSTLYSELLLLEARTGLALEKDELPLADPTTESALRCAHACLDLGVRIEGESTRLQFLRAQCVRSEGGMQDAADRLAILLRSQTTKTWYQVAQESRQSALLALGRYEQVAEIGAALLRHDVMRPAAAFNRLTAHAWMGMESEFRESALRFKHAVDGVPDPGYWSRLVSEEAPWFAARFRLSPNDVYESLTLPSQRPGS